MTLFYKQCRLVKRTSQTTAVELTSWIPEKYAQLHNYVQLKQADGSFVDGWEVTCVSTEKLSEAHLPDSHAMIKGHKKATGDALPKLK
ncbi:hypothetical protein DTL21_10625 [Bremerella cremea]|uniref:Uncharacterized protein n=1 Tax=Blastopirellula marina TaxID=124 RepID=A0A2S8FW11_9BACT|nr:MULTISPECIES: hypothetical protein [Pirellulaceae]PQO36343.1 hypothetical protein C5Y83_10620 [Blastopirellula marina]RCS49020.1 hypothetical protein DTL21_10625 [Bremerella cremea]